MAEWLSVHTGGVLWADDPGRRLGVRVAMTTSTRPLQRLTWATPRGVDYSIEFMVTVAMCDVGS